MAPSHTILLVEGRKPTSEYLAPIVNGQGHSVATAHTRRDALTQAVKVEPALIVLDTPSLRFSARRFCEALRDAELDIPVLILLAEGERIDRAAGARAHMRYPVSAKKLVNRIVRLLPAPEDEILKVGSIVLNVKQRYVVRGNHESPLTPKQAQLLEVFMRHPGEVLTRAFLMKQVWDTDYLDDTRTLDVHIHWVRKAIEENPRSPTYLRTVRRLGYRLEAPGKRKKGRKR